MTMRLLVEGELKPAGGIIGLGFDEFRWPGPVHPGDELHQPICRRVRTCRISHGS
jgi:acyl dehydratase